MKDIWVARKKQVIDQGITARALALAVSSGRLTRVRPGWYATPDAPDEVVRAVRVGGALTSLSASRLAGIWTPPDAFLHVAVPRNASRLRSPQSAARPLSRLRDKVCVHSLPEAVVVETPVLSMARIVGHAAVCQSEEMAVTVIDSALNMKLVTELELQAEFATLPRRCRRALEKADRRSQSGIESLVRVRLRRLGIHLTVQANISGVGHVDLLVGERLVIECDSHSWHWLEDSYAEDHRRDAILVSMNYIVFRVTYEMVLFDWPWVESVVRTQIAGRKHLWPRRNSAAPIGEYLGGRI